VFLNEVRTVCAEPKMVTLGERPTAREVLHAEAYFSPFTWHRSTLRKAPFSFFKIFSPCLVAMGVGRFHMLRNSVFLRVIVFLLGNMVAYTRPHLPFSLS
jgi:hypothetical protein